jgi:hypothetical protein
VVWYFLDQALLKFFIDALNQDGLHTLVRAGGQDLQLAMGVQGQAQSELFHGPCSFSDTGIPLLAPRLTVGEQNI